MTKPEQEYTALRDEMTQRQERMHGTLTYTVGATLAGLAFALTANNGNLPPALVLRVALLIQVLLCLAAWYMADNQRMIYRIGTYLALSYEGDKAPPRWLRVSRTYGDWLRDLSKAQAEKIADRRLPRWWRRWGTGAKNTGWILLAMSLATYAGIVVPNIAWGSLQLDVRNIVASLSVISLPAVVLVVWQTLFKFSAFRKREELFLGRYLQTDAAERIAHSYAPKPATRISPSDSPSART